MNIVKKIISSPWRLVAVVFGIIVLIVTLFHLPQIFYLVNPSNNYQNTYTLTDVLQSTAAPEIAVDQNTYTFTDVLQSITQWVASLVGLIALGVFCVSLLIALPLSLKNKQRRVMIYKTLLWSGLIIVVVWITLEIVSRSMYELL